MRFFVSESAPRNTGSGNFVRLDSPPIPKGEELSRRREPRVTDSCVGRESRVPWNGTFVGWELSLES